MTLKIALLFACCFAAALSLTCNTIDNCKPTQCCVDNYRFQIVSKRAVFGTIKDGIFQRGKGVCVDYVAQGASCHMPGFASCGCIPGTKCNYYPDATNKRKIVFRPGNSFCEAEQ